MKRMATLLLALSACRQSGTADDPSMQAPPEQKESKLKWWKSFEEARASGARRVFVFFAEKGDHASATFEEMLQGEEVVAALAPTACVKTDRNDPRFASLKFGSTPACAFFTLEGREIESKEYGPTKAEFLKWIRDLP